MIVRHEDESSLTHYGILRRSGRYPWGSGKTESARNRSYLDTIEHLKSTGLSETQIAESFGITTTELRAAKTIALAQQKQENIMQAQRLRAHGLSHQAIGERMGGLNESSVRALLAPGAADKAKALLATANDLQKQVDKVGMLDVGKGNDARMGLTQTRFNTALAVLREKGYEVHTIEVQQPGTGKFTKTKVLAKPGISKSYVQRNRDQIQLIRTHSTDGGRTFVEPQPPISISSRRIQVNYAPEGAKADGVIFVRPGARNLSLGADRYAQVRILVDNTHYLKGMAVVKEDLPPGVDLVFNTKKPNTGRKKDAMKPISPDPELPFGSITRQITDKKGNVSSAMNIVGVKEGSGAEGAWDTWSRNLSAQMLSKQSPALAKQQLALTHERRVRELKEIQSLTNPTVKKTLLLGFADSTDSAAVHLKAASLPRQATKVLLPISSMKPGEVYARGLRDGERVALVRFPHAGRFEIPELVVNNRNREARKLLGPAKDAIGIHHSVAQRLSGADFDGDTVLVIPNNRGLVKSAPALERLKKFDPMDYALPKDSPIPRMTARRKGLEMGSISNLITDMSLRGADSEELARAVAHSMVVIDAENHELNFLQSEKDHGIRQLKEKYQGGKRAGASTLISRKEANVRIPQIEPRKPSRGGPIDPATGKLVFERTGRTRPEFKTRIDPATGKRVRIQTGEPVPLLTKVERLSPAITDDAHTLSSGTVIETIYANHSNKLKSMANAARKEALGIKALPQSGSAKKAYAPQVETLLAKLNEAKKNAPLERQALLLANAKVGQRRQANPGMEPDELKKIKQFELKQARVITGAEKKRIAITQEEWNAIQAGAISNHKLSEILANTDLDVVKKYAMPKHTRKLSNGEINRAKQMQEAGFTDAEIADQLGIGLTTLKLGLEQ